MGSPIVGGAPTTGWDAVVLIRTNIGGICSGTLVSPDVVLTAAHCLEGIAPPVDVYWCDDYPGLGYDDWLQSSDYHQHPDFDLLAMTDDIGVILLPQEAQATPVPINRDPAAPDWLDPNNPLMFIGFGVTGYGLADWGVKREVEMDIDLYYDDILLFLDTLHQTCFGDSGGPAMTDHNGDWAVAGVTSGGDGNCSKYGAAVEVAVYEGWIDGHTGGWDPYADDDADGWTVGDGDCDDADPWVNPGADEECNGLDDDCDDEIDEPDAIDASTWYADLDGDGFGDVASAIVACDAPADHVADATDCDDLRAVVHPGAVEYCNGFDDDCDGAIDEEDAVDPFEWYADGDQDGFGGAGAPVLACDPPPGHADNADDCDDGDPLVHPGALEVQCNGVDDDCDAATADAPDQDGDGASVCVDCDDADPSRHPGAAEVSCNNLDDDCDPATEDAPDGDGDGVSLCHDCDDTDPAAFPGAVEDCLDGVDNDCDGLVDAADLDDCPMGDDDDSAGDDDDSSGDDDDSSGDDDDVTSDDDDATSDDDDATSDDDDATSDDDDATSDDDDATSDDDDATSDDDDATSDDDDATSDDDASAGSGDGRQGCSCSAATSSSPGRWAAVVLLAAFHLSRRRR